MYPFSLWVINGGRIFATVYFGRPVFFFFFFFYVFSSVNQLIAINHYRHISNIKNAFGSVHILREREKDKKKKKSNVTIIIGD